MYIIIFILLSLKYRVTSYHILIAFMICWSGWCLLCKLTVPLFCFVCCFRLFRFGPRLCSITTNSLIMPSSEFDDSLVSSESSISWMSTSSSSSSSSSSQMSHSSLSTTYSVSLPVAESSFCSSGIYKKLQFISYIFLNIVKPRFNKTLFNDVLDMSKLLFFQFRQNYTKMFRDRKSVV